MEPRLLKVGGKFSSTDRQGVDTRVNVDAGENVYITTECISNVIHTEIWKHATSRNDLHYNSRQSSTSMVRSNF